MNTDLTLEFLREIVRKAGSQSKLAQKLDISRSAVSRWFSGSSISLENAHKMSKTYGVPLEFLHPRITKYKKVLNEINRLHD